MRSPGEDGAARLIRGQGRILEALAEADEPLTGMLDRFEGRFGLAHAELWTCLLELALAGWIAIRIQPFGRVTIELQREGTDSPPVTVTGVRCAPARRFLPAANVTPRDIWYACINSGPGVVPTICAPAGSPLQRPVGRR